MSLRLILFIIALLVIAWIIWEHKRKGNKQNRYVAKKRMDASLLFITNKKLVKDIDDEMIRDDRSNSTKTNQNIEETIITTDIFSNSDFDDIQLDPTDPRDYERIKYKANPIFTPDDDIDTEFPVNNIKYNNYEIDDFEDNTDLFVEKPVKQTAKQTISEESYHEQQVVTKPAGVDTTISTSKAYVEEESIQQVFTLYVKAKNTKGFRGDELLHGLLSVGCRFGDMNIFHRHEKTSGQGHVMFSVASMVNPGVFDINNMQRANIPGVVLFFTYPGTSEPAMVFDLMLKTAFKLAKHLDGEILDENRAVLTSDKTQEIRDQIELIEINEIF